MLESSLPHELQVGKFLQSRNQEIQQLVKEVSKSKIGGQLASQQVPRHMRRRAVSHNPARLPRRLRPAHNIQKTKSGGEGAVVKRPSRKYRRRPSNLLNEYNRRQRNIIWLETHIWHAKRYHMSRKWGHAIPSTPTDKGWRACFRAASKSCLMWDQSYLHLVELVGEKEVMLDNLNKLTDNRTGKVFTVCQQERKALVYKQNTYPAGFVGEVSYLWRPGHDHLWIWVHPAFYAEFIILMKDILGLREEENLGEPNLKKIRLDESSESVKKNVVQSKLEPKLLPPPVLTSSVMQVTLSGNTLNRFRIVGPLSSALLKHCLVPANLEPTSVTSKDWWADYYSSQERQLGVNESNNVWKSLNNAPPASNNIVLGLVVRDPRLIMSHKRNTAKLEYEEAEFMSELIKTPTVSLRFSESPLWNSSVRTMASEAREQESVINKLRGEALVPGTPLHLGDREGRVPVLVIGTEHGWDLVIPAGWAMSFWMCMVYAGCRTAGSQELEHFELEHFKGKSVDLEDSEFGKCEANLRQQQIRKKHFFLPPDKRTNHAKMGIASPFGPKWGMLLADWKPKVELGQREVVDDWYILRDTSILERLKNNDSIEDFPELVIDKALIRVRVLIRGKGVINENAVLCVPRESDYEESSGEIFEPLQSDDLEQERKVSKKLHKEKMKRQKRQWKKVKNKQVLMIAQSVAEEKEIDQERLTLLNNNLSALKRLRDEENSRYMIDSEKLWEGPCNTIRGSCTREVVGWVVKGSYSYKLGGEVGEGLVCLRGWLDLVARGGRQTENLVLTRNTNSLNYRKAAMELVDK